MAGMMLKHQVMLFLKTASSWQRIGKSTVLTIAANPTTETYDYIDAEGPTSDIRRYSPSIEQDLSTIVGNPDFELIWDYYYNKKTGSDAQSEVMIVYAGIAGTGASSYKAEKAACTIQIDGYDAVASKLNFSIMFGGSVTQGDATLVEGVPTFTPAA